MAEKEDLRDLLGRPIEPECPPQEGLWGQPVRRIRLEDMAGTTRGIDEMQGEPSCDINTGYLFYRGHSNGVQEKLYPSENN
ncbi:MAG: hypothetical protein AABX53_00810 [Nanoarchaeota archaeon]